MLRPGKIRDLSKRCRLAVLFPADVVFPSTTRSTPTSTGEAMGVEGRCDDLCCIFPTMMERSRQFSCWHHRYIAEALSLDGRERSQDKSINRKSMIDVQSCRPWRLPSLQEC